MYNPPNRCEIYKNNVNSWLFLVVFISILLYYRMSILLKKDRIHYLYIGHLVLRVAPSSFSKLFDRHYNGGFKAALQREENKLEELKKEEIISQDQWQQLSKLAG